MANFFMRCLGMCLYACFSGFVKLWSSLTLRATFADIPCILRVLQVRMREICVSTNSCIIYMCQAAVFLHYMSLSLTTRVLVR